jgi:glycosyltransferase involved in cell wall biosynthesis
MSGVSVLILTLNEECNIGQCIESCRFSDDIVVFDSFSDDGTVSLATSRGVRVVQRRFDDYSAQRNAALSSVSYRHPWVLMVDADERVPAELAREVAAAVAAAEPDTVLFRMRRKDFFLGRWLKRSSGYPTWFGRLLRLGRVHLKHAYNEESVADGRVGYLKEHLHHFPFNKGVDFWFERHNRYSSMEANAKMDGQGQPLSLGALFARDPIERRRMLKRMLYLVPGRPLIVFFYLYIVRLGILDGVPGYYFSRMRAAYEMLIDVKVMESRRRQRDAAV